MHLDRVRNGLKVFGYGGCSLTEINKIIWLVLLTQMLEFLFLFFGVVGLLTSFSYDIKPKQDSKQESCDPVTFIQHKLH